MKPNNVLVIGDTHEPFSHKNYLDFCKRMRDRCKCETIIHIGDLPDNHAISYHETDPDGMCAGREYDKALKKAMKWYKSFPKVKLCRGNHDRLVNRKGKTIGLPKAVFKPFRDIWEMPKGWEDEWEYKIDGVLYEHGTSYSGKFPHVTAAMNNRCSTVIGHCHSVAGIEFMANNNDRIFGMSVGCGIDRKSWAFAYGKAFKRKPILGVGIVTDNGKYAQFMPMFL